MGYDRTPSQDYDLCQTRLFPLTISFLSIFSPFFPLLFPFFFSPPYLKGFVRSSGFPDIPSTSPPQPFRHSPRCRGWDIFVPEFIASHRIAQQGVSRISFFFFSPFLFLSLPLPDEGHRNGDRQRMRTRQNGGGYLLFVGLAHLHLHILRGSEAAWMGVMLCASLADGYYLTVDTYIGTLGIIACMELTIFAAIIYPPVLLLGCFVMVSC